MSKKKGGGGGGEDLPPPSGMIPRLRQTPWSDIPIKRGGKDVQCGSSSSRFAGSQPLTFLELPLLSDVPPQQRRALFLRKLDQCQIVFDFLDGDDQDGGLSREREKELKRESPHGVDHDTYSNVVQMVSVNLFHPLPPRLNPNGAEYDPEEDEPILEAAWPHIMIVYELFLSFLDMPNFSATVASALIDKQFVCNLIALFDSEDPRERDYLKTTLHRVYGKLMNLRPLIRAEITMLFINTAEQHHPHNGIAELLEIMGSIINGFAVPIKPEHTQMLYRALLPLHKSSHVALFRRQLVYCVAQFVEKDQTLAPRVFEYLVRNWPRARQAHVMYRIEELYALLPLLDDKRFRQTSTVVFPRLAECIEGDHFGVVDKALAVLKHEAVVELIYRFRQIVMPIVLPCLFKASKHIQHEVLRKRAHDVLRHFMSMDRALFASCTERYRADSKAKQRVAKQRDDLWHVLEERAQLQAAGVPEHMLIQIAPLSVRSVSNAVVPAPGLSNSAAAVLSSSVPIAAVVPAEAAGAASSSTSSSLASALAAPDVAVTSSQSNNNNNNNNNNAESLKTQSSSPTESDSMPSPRVLKSHKSESKKKLKSSKKKKKSKTSSESSATTMHKLKSSSSSTSPPPMPRGSTTSPGDHRK